MIMASVRRRFFFSGAWTGLVSLLLLGAMVLASWWDRGHGRT